MALPIVAAMAAHPVITGMIASLIASLGVGSVKDYIQGKHALNIEEKKLDIGQAQFLKQFGAQDEAYKRFFGLQREQMDLQKTMAHRQMNLQERQAMRESDLMRAQLAKQPDAFQQQIMAMAAAMAGRASGGDDFRSMMIGG